MLDAALSLATASGGGAILGLIGNWIAGSVEKHRMTLESYRQANQQTIDGIRDHAKEFKVSEANKVIRRLKIWGFEWTHEYTKIPKAINPPFASSVLLIAWTYCACTLVCFLLGDIIVATQNPTAEPTVTTWAWGAWSQQHSNDTISVVTFASVGTYMAHFLAFILSAVITGVVPKRN